LETMPTFSRRRFLAVSASALVAAGPARGAVSSSGEVDVAIVGAGAAGISAARRAAAARQSYALLEASDRVGGRCITDRSIFGVPFDRGAHWIHMPDLNPVAKLTARAGFDIYPAPPGQKIRISRRNAREGEMENFLASLLRASRAIGDAARGGKADISCAQALPRDLADWKPAVDFVLGPYGCGKDLAEVSAADFALSVERDVDSFCRQGYGALLAKLADGLTVQLNTPVTQIDAYGRGGAELETPRGKIRAKAVIVTVSTSVLASGRIKFLPEMPKRLLDAVAKLQLGSYDHIALELPGNPLGLARDDLVFEKSDSARTGALLANMSSTAIGMVDVGGKFGRELSAQGEAAMVDFALGWLVNLFGADVKKAVRRTHATRWNNEPYVLGAFSAASPGGQPGRKILMEPFAGRVWFAGEAVHETLWGTVGGAWESGERAVDAALKRGAPSERPAPRQRKSPKRRS
jgi:monoamine oxidase